MKQPKGRLFDERGKRGKKKRGLTQRASSSGKGKPKKCVSDGRACKGTLRREELLARRGKS